MPRQKLFYTRWSLSLFIALVVIRPVLAQSNSPDSALIVTASATSERVRFTAPATIVQLRLEVLSDSGQVLFDAQSKGNVLDWSLQDGAGQRVAEGTYLCVVTVKSLSGHLRQRTGSLQISNGQINLQKMEGSQMTPAQQQTVGPVESDSSVSVLEQDGGSAVTTVAHNGTDGEIVRSTGALSFRLGDFYSGKDAEQMRLTAEGNLGIGTDSPQAKLDVNGVIRAERGFQFSDGSLLNVSPKGALKITSPSGSTKNVNVAGGDNISGTGTQNVVAKWTDNAGTLGDSSVSEVNGQVGIGTTNPQGQLHIFGTAGQDVFAGMGPDLINGPALNFGYAGSSFGRGAGFFNVRPDVSAVAPNPSLRFATSNVERMIITNTGNVGIGTTTPQTQLQIKTVTGVYGFTHTDGAISVGSYVGGSVSGATGGWLGTQSNHKLFFFTGNGQPSMTVDTNGNIGIGTTVPGFKLDVAGNFRSVSGASNDIFVVTAGGTNAWARLNMQTNNQTWALGTSQNFNGNQFYLYDSTDNVTRMTVQPGFGPTAFLNGNVGIGLTLPPHRLSISGGPTWTNNGWTGSVSLDNASAIGWDTNTAGNHFGIGQTNGGLYFFRTSSNLGSSAAAANYSMILDDGGNMTVNGNVSQPRDKAGYPKAMIYVNADGTIGRCYNGVSSSGNCFSDFGVTNPSTGLYTLTFPFQVSDRFVVATTNGGETGVSVSNVVTNSSQMHVQIYYISNNNHTVGGQTNDPFYLIVY